MIWFGKKLASLTVVLICHGIATGLYVGAVEFVDYLATVDMPWGKIFGGVMAAALIGFNWWQMDDILWS